MSQHIRAQHLIIHYKELASQHQHDLKITLKKYYAILLKTTSIDQKSLEGKLYIHISASSHKGPF